MWIFGLLLSTWKKFLLQLYLSFSLFASTQEHTFYLLVNIKYEKGFLVGASSRKQIAPKICHVNLSLNRADLFQFLFLILYFVCSGSWLIINMCLILQGSWPVIWSRPDWSTFNCEINLNSRWRQEVRVDPSVSLHQSVYYWSMWATEAFMRPE